MEETLTRVWSGKVETVELVEETISWHRLTFLATNWMLLAKIIELMVNLVVNVGDGTKGAGGKNEMVVVGCRWSQQGASCKGMVAANYGQPLLDDSTYPERRKEILKGEEVKE